MAGTISDDDLGFGGQSQGTEPNYLAALGRISGKALADNLERNGIDLTFRNGSGDTDLLYLDVTNKRLGINRENPDFALEIVGTSKVTNDVIVNGTSAKLSNIIFGTNGTISTQVGPINIVPSGTDPYVQYGKVLTDDLEINNNYIKAGVTNQPIEMFAHGTGIVDIQSSTVMAGNLEVTQNIQVDGNVQFNGQFIIGDSPIDTLTVQTDFTQSLIPGATATYDLGTASKRWKNINLTSAQSVQTISIVTAYINQTTLAGNQISSSASNDDMIFNVGNSEKSILLGDFTITDSTIVNTLPANTLLFSTGTGYYQINDTSAMLIPTGTDGQRPYSEIGETRWNSDRGYLECYDGNIYLIATGGGAIVSEALMEEFGDLYALMLG